MNYSEIVSTALGYADRQDTEITGKMDLFLKMVESKINRRLEIQPLVNTVETVIVDNVYEYALPSDYLSLKDIKIVNTDNENNAYPLEMASAERVTTFRITGEDQRIYAIVGDNIFICSNPYESGVNNVLRIAYYQKCPALTSLVTTNWVSDNHPDAYIFGLQVEINAYVKDAAATMLWQQRFDGVLAEISDQDKQYVWGGPTLNIKVA